jgi:hypothetical protein
MKTIFLDIDGVIALGYTKRQESKWGTIYRFDKKAVDTLNLILKETDAEIVLSSDWKKLYSLQDMIEIFQWNGVIKSPISFTINSKLYDQADTIEFMAGARASEIKDYVERHRLSNWVAIDDLPIHYSGLSDFFIGHFIHCPRVLEGIKQTGLSDNIINILKKF